MLIHSATQLLTLAGGPQRGKSLGSLGIIENGAALQNRDPFEDLIYPLQHRTQQSITRYNL